MVLVFKRKGEGFYRRRWFRSSWGVKLLSSFLWELKLYFLRVFREVMFIGKVSLEEEGLDRGGIRDGLVIKDGDFLGLCVEDMGLDFGDCLVELGMRGMVGVFFMVSFWGGWILGLVDIGWGGVI